MTNTENSSLKEIPPQNSIRLTDLIKAYAPHDGRFELPMSGMYVVRVSKTNTQSTHTTSKPGVCLITQGAKRVILGKNIYEYDNTRMIVYSAEVPVATNIIKANRTEPYLAVVIGIDPKKLIELTFKVYPQELPKIQSTSAICLAQTDAAIISAAIRLIELMAQPDDIELLAPLIIEEIFIRLLRSSIGTSIAQFSIADSNSHKIAKAIHWLGNNYTQTIKVEDLAERVNMSSSSFHQHFKAITAISPLQFQKVLRLQEARNLMLSQIADVSTTGLRVGYASLSQFSREYSRYFGCSPTKDITRLRNDLIQKSHLT